MIKANSDQVAPSTSIVIATRGLDPRGSISGCRALDRSRLLRRTSAPRNDGANLVEICSIIRTGLMAALVACALTVATAAADEPEAAGMVIKVTGGTEPDLPARTEIPAHTAIKLGSDAQLTFLHYGKCKLITVAGGTLQLSKRNFTTDGKVENEAPGPCPRIYQIKGDAGGWVSRDVPPRLPVDAEIIFTGRRADKVVEASIYSQDRADKPLFRLKLANRRATEPPDAELTADKTYVLQVKLSDQPSPLEHGFVAIASGSRSSLVVLRID